jgi:hypothetical protein
VNENSKALCDQVEPVIALWFFIEHDLRANAPRFVATESRCALCADAALPARIMLQFGPTVHGPMAMM